MAWPRSLRARFMVVAVVAAIAPLALLGVWLTSVASRSGQEVIRRRLDDLLASSAGVIGKNWLGVRSDLLDLSESPEVRGLLAGDPVNGLPTLPPPVERLSLFDLSDHTVWSGPAPGTNGSSTPGPLLRIRMPVFRGRTSERIGSIEVGVDLGTLLEGPQPAGIPVGTVLGALDPATGSSLLPVPFDRSLLGQEHFRWAGEDWVTRRRTLHEPRIELVAAAQVSPLTEPFEHAAGQGLLLLGAIALLSLLLTAGLTGVMTRSLGRLTSAADAVSRGEFEHRIEPTGNDEIGHVADAFNTMTASLRNTLRELADRQSLAAVGEFAASLSHEVRNALSSIRLDLQVSGEHLPEDPRLREPQERALREITRLEETVSGALELARSGRLDLVPLDLRLPLANAVAAARPEFAARGASLEEPAGGARLEVVGDGAGLEQLFLNLLLNAAQAAGAGGTARVRVDKRAKEVHVTVEDDGSGMTPDVLDRAFEAFYSTRRDGTGLGLSVARRIARVHGGHLAIDSGPRHGTSVEVTLPLVGERAREDESESAE